MLGGGMGYSVKGERRYSSGDGYEKEIEGCVHDLGGGGDVRDPSADAEAV
jgi:hypothetical protein